MLLFSLIIVKTCEFSVNSCFQFLNSQSSVSDFLIVAFRVLQSLLLPPLSAASSSIFQFRCRSQARNPPPKYVFFSLPVSKQSLFCFEGWSCSCCSYSTQVCQEGYENFISYAALSLLDMLQFFLSRKNMLFAVWFLFINCLLVLFIHWCAESFNFMLHLKESSNLFLLHEFWVVVLLWVIQWRLLIFYAIYFEQEFSVEFSNC